MGSKLRAATSECIRGRGLPPNHKLVLLMAASMIDENKPDPSWWGGLASLAAACDMEVSNLRKILRRYEGRPAAVSTARMPTGLDPGRFFYPVERESRQGDGAPNRYLFAIPHVPPGGARRTPHNPTGRTRASSGRGLPLPSPLPPHTPVTVTDVHNASAGEGRVTVTEGEGNSNLRTPVTVTDKSINEVESMRGVDPPPPPPQEKGKAGEGPRPASPPANRPALVKRGDNWTYDRQEDPRKGQDDQAGEVRSASA